MQRQRFSPWVPRLRRIGLLTLALLASGCGPAQVEHQNRDLIESLLTAVSARNPEWLAENQALIASRRAAGTLSAADAATLGPIVALAQAGRWSQAESLAFDLRDAQAPTAQDRVADAQRQLPPPEHAPTPPRRTGRPPRQS